MTVEKAIWIMKAIKEYADMTEVIDECSIAIEEISDATSMAISALEGKDTNVPSTDTISRQDAISGVRELYSMGDCYCDECSVVWMLNSLPSSQPEPDRGEWLPDNNNYYEERFICSVCGRSYKVGTCMGKPMWDFCPCGADMRGKNNGKTT